jgi:FG-GAP repeat
VRSSRTRRAPADMVPFHIPFTDVRQDSANRRERFRTLAEFTRSEVAMNGLLPKFLRSKAKGALCSALTSFILVSAPHPAGAQFTQQGSELVAPDGDTAHMQGGSVALSADGDTAIIGAPLRPTTPAPEVGAAFVFTRIGSTWSEQAKLVGTDYVQCSVCSVAQGWSVALSADGNTAIVGGPDDNNNIGAAWVFARSGSTWSQQGSKLLASDAAPPTGLGSSVALSADGNTAVIGGWLDNNETGAIWVFTRSGGVWSQQGLKLVGSNAVGAALQGFSVALSGDGTTAIVGGRYDNSNAGASWVFTRRGEVWAQQGDKLVGSNAVGAAHEAAGQRHGQQKSRLVGCAI